MDNETIRIGNIETMSLDQGMLRSNIKLKQKNKKSRTANRRLAQWRVQWLIEHSTSHQLLRFIDSLCSEIRHCAKRQNVGGHAKKMTTKTVTYRDWTFEVDYERTKEVYDKVKHGSPEGCACNDCKNFAANRENIYPYEIKNLLSEFGIDYKKESEIFHMARLESGLHHYGGWFHFKGKIIEGKDCKIDLGGGGSTFDTAKVADDFEIAFMKGSDLTFFDKEENDDLIQIEFIADSEWVIDKEIESE